MKIDAKILYEAVTATISRTGVTGLLAAAGDARERVPWDDASPKTRILFEELLANLTAQAPPA